MTSPREDSPAPWRSTKPHWSGGGVEEERGEEEERRGGEGKGGENGGQGEGEGEKEKKGLGRRRRRGGGEEEEEEEQKQEEEEQEQEEEGFQRVQRCRKPLTNRGDRIQLRPRSGFALADGPERGSRAWRTQAEPPEAQPVLTHSHFNPIPTHLAPALRMRLFLSTAASILIHRTGPPPGHPRPHREPCQVPGTPAPPDSGPFSSCFSELQRLELPGGLE